MVKKTHKR